MLRTVRMDVPCAHAKDGLQLRQVLTNVARVRVGIWRFGGVMTGLHESGWRASGECEFCLWRGRLDEPIAQGFRE